MDGDSRIGSGQTADILAIGDDRVLKRFDPGTSVGVARLEAENTRVADEAGLPVPTVHEVTSVDGQPAIVFDRIDGPTMRSRLTARPWTLWRNARRLATLHTTLHATRAPGLRSLREKLTRRIREASGLSVDVRQRALSKLNSLSEGDALCHGDLHPENVLLSEDGPVIIDWLDAASGAPAADAARTNVILQFADQQDGWVSSKGRQVFRRAYLRQYCSRTDVSRSEIRAWELPIAAARLPEAVSEGPRLRSFVRSRLAEQ